MSAKLFFIMAQVRSAGFASFAICSICARGVAFLCRGLAIALSTGSPGSRSIDVPGTGKLVYALPDDDPDPGECDG
ncbi:hypothetical protein [Azonexus sp.]|uniref:hypothetical protein n=1 Tax=Azonexus sp. TaxID=1872668 RepID=UPI0035B476EB